MPTGKKPASDAGKGLRNKKTTKPQRTVDASDLAQAPREPAPKKPAAKKPAPKKPAPKKPAAKKPAAKTPAARKQPRKR
jgi:hypothetical protein